MAAKLPKEFVDSILEEIEVKRAKERQERIAIRIKAINKLYVHSAKLSTEDGKRLLISEEAWVNLVNILEEEELTLRPELKNVSIEGLKGYDYPTPKALDRFRRKVLRRQAVRMLITNAKELAVDKPNWNPPLGFWKEVLEAFENLLLDKEPDLKSVKPPKFSGDVQL